MNHQTLLKTQQQRDRILSAIQTSTICPLCNKETNPKTNVGQNIPYQELPRSSHKSSRSHDRTFFFPPKLLRQLPHTLQDVGDPSSFFSHALSFQGNQQLTAPQRDSITSIEGPWHYQSAGTILPSSFAQLSESLNVFLCDRSTDHMKLKYGKSIELTIELSRVPSKITPLNIQRE